jgi:uncharacterized NAD(P)/FAD-binding protein YdhS
MQAGSAIQTIAIVGGGYSGAMLSVELLRRAAGQVSILLIERNPVPGLGAAYGTTFEGHLLNVRAENMSAYADRPDDFVNWARQNYSSSVTADDFLPRKVYGQYIVAQLREEVRFSGDQFRHVNDEAVSLNQVNGMVQVGLASGKFAIADRVVLAFGHFPPADLRLPGKKADSAYFIANPWSRFVLNGIGQTESVLLIGTGLTSVDVMMELRARGVAGTIHMLSRRALLPQRHAPIKIVPCEEGDFSRAARGLLRTIRQRVSASVAQGGDWREVVDSLRPVTQKIWRGLPLVEQKRVLRHLRTYWDVHRHRIAERVADDLSEQIREGTIQVHAGRITDYREVEGGVEIAYRERSSGEVKTFRVNRVINCTGPDGDFRRVSSPFLADIMAKGLARPDEHSMGLDVTDDGAVIDARGVASDRVYALGPLRKGKLWESIAVPELRMQNAELADLLVKASGKPAANHSRLLCATTSWRWRNIKGTLVHSSGPVCGST